MSPPRASAFLDTSVESYGPYCLIMASTTIKSTYSLDVETVGALEGIARRWNVSMFEALRRAIRSAAAGEDPGIGTPLRVLDRL